MDLLEEVADLARAEMRVAGGSGSRIDRRLRPSVATGRVASCAPLALAPVRVADGDDRRDRRLRPGYLDSRTDFDESACGRHHGVCSGAALVKSGSQPAHLCPLAGSLSVA